MSVLPTMAFALNTKDRCEFTQRILPSLDVGPEVHLYWFDGSDTNDGINLPSIKYFERSVLKEIHYGIRGGPDVAIRYSLRRLLDKGYEYLGLIENDVLLEPGWVTALFAAISDANNEGLTVGAATVRTIASRCLLSRQSYAPMWNMGAGMVLFTRDGASAVLEDYHVITSQDLGSFWQTLGFELHSWDLWRDQPDRGLGADWWYAGAMLKRGLVSIGTIPTFARNIDFDIEADLRTNYLGKSDCLPGQLNNTRVLFEKYAPEGPEQAPAEPML